MKKIMLSAVMLLGLGFIVSAHPPADIIISVDLATSTVRVDIMHGSKNVEKHYINQVNVKVNGKKVIKQDESTQIDNEKQLVIYVIAGLKEGDKLSVEADCNMFGDLEKEIIVKAPAPQPSETKKPASKPEANASSKFKVK